MVTAFNPLREQLVDRRHRLGVAVRLAPEAQLARLLQEVDMALGRMDEGTYGLCDVCHDPVETERLIADPLTRLCLDHLSATEQRALEDDLALAVSIQRELLPQTDYRAQGWEIAYHYQPAGLVSGDYCDLIEGEKGDLYFIVGDVSGKGVAASMLMGHLHAMFRTLVSVNLPLDKMVERASRVFCESTLPTHYATLVCGRAEESGMVEICNAGHLPPLFVHGDCVTKIGATGLPLGIFSSEEFSLSRFQMQAGDNLLLYSDGLTEACDGASNEYGSDRLGTLLRETNNQAPLRLIENCVRDLNSFSAGGAQADDLTIMAIQRADPVTQAVSL